MIEKKQFLQVINATPLVSVDLLVQDSDDNVLLGKRNNRPAQGSWFVPGGRIRKNETIAEAFKRIVSTELGADLPFEAATLYGAYDHIYDDNYYGVEGINTHYVVLAYRVVLSGDKKIMADDQHAELKFWSIEELLDTESVHQNTKDYFVGYS